MTACEKCWADAALRVALLGGSQVQHYQDLLRERANHPCSQVYIPERRTTTDKERTRDE